MRNSRAYLAITAPLNLRMSGFCSVRMLSLSTDYSKVNKYLLENHFSVKDSDNFKILKGCHIRENVHVFFVTSKKRSTEKKSCSVVGKSHGKGITGDPRLGMPK